MRRTDLINSVQKIANVFKEEGIQQIFMKYDGKDSDPELVFTTFQKFSREYDNFNENDKKVLIIFNLNGLASSKVWSDLIKDKNSRMNGYSAGIYHITDYFEKLINLLRQDNVKYLENDNHHLIKISESPEQAVLTVILPEKEGVVSKPERLIQVLESINSYYECMGQILQIEGSNLSIAAIDSGSDKSFDFLGAAKFMVALKELLLDLWNSVIFHKERKTGEGLDLIAKSLPIIERVDQLEKSQVINHEDAEHLKRKLIKATEKFLVCGAVIPEFEANSKFDPKKLMAAEPKLLATTGVVADSQTHILIDDDSELSEEEEKQFQQLMKKKQNKK